MNRLLIVILFCMSTASLIFGQEKVRGSWMSKDDISSFLLENKQNLDIIYPVAKLYEFKDSLGEGKIILTEEISKIVSGDTLYHNIKAHLINRVSGDKWKNVLSIKDFTVGKEESIWFWTPYCVFEDIDGDGIVDPVIVYGSDEGIGGTNSRMKIGVFYKGKKVFIRHQSSTIVAKNSTQIDPAFYELPDSIQTRVMSIMRKLSTEGWVKYTPEWEKKITVVSQ